MTDIVSVAVFNEEKEEAAIFAVNRNLDEDIALTVDMRSFEGYKLSEQIILSNDDLKAENSAEQEKVFPVSVQLPVSEMESEVLLKKASWNVIRLKKA